MERRAAWSDHDNLLRIEEQDALDPSVRELEDDRRMKQQHWQLSKDFAVCHASMHACTGRKKSWVAKATTVFGRGL